MFVDAYHAAITLAGRTGTIWVIEAEEVRVWFLEGYSVGFKSVGKPRHRRLAAARCLLTANYTFAASFEESRLHRFGYAGRLAVVIVVYLDAVNQQHHIATLS